MTEYVPLLVWPFLVSLVLVGIHVYFGLHVIKRGIIFIDLSLAQVAAFGMAVSMLAGFPPDSNTGYFLSLGFALLGGLIFTLTRDVSGRIPHEAVIGIVYAVCAAATVVAMSHSPEGSEQVRYLLVGSILTVTPSAVAKTAAVYAAVGLFHWILRDRFLELTFGDGSTGACSKVWDFLFYATFAVVVTSSVRICGVLLVFIFLVVPSVFAALLTDSIAKRLLLGWAFGFVGSALGIVCSVWLDTPTGATIVCVFGLMLVAGALIRKTAEG